VVVTKIGFTQNPGRDFTGAVSKASFLKPPLNPPRGTY